MKHRSFLIQRQGGKGEKMSDFHYSNAAREMAVYGYDQVVKSHCRMCHGGCGVLIYMQEGTVAKIAGDPDCPINHGTLCSK